MSELKDLLNDFSKLTPEVVEKLEEYRSSIDMLASNGWNLEFTNKDHNHAALVMSNIFSTATKSLKVYTGSFSGEVSDNPIYLNELSSSMHTPDKTLEVVFEKKPNVNSKCLEMLRRLKKEGKNVKLFLLNSEYQKTVEKKSLGHFTIGDNNIFRYETDKINFRAFCNFDDEDFVQKLNENFFILKLNSVPLD